MGVHGLAAFTELRVAPVKTGFQRLGVEVILVDRKRVPFEALALGVVEEVDLAHAQLVRNRPRPSSLTFWTPQVLV